MCAMYQADPKESDLKATERILRYIKGSKNLGLFYPKSKTFELMAYTDADYGRCKIDRKSTSGICYFLGKSLVTWPSKKQNTIALSSTEVEYVAASLCCTQVFWIKHQLEDCSIHLERILIKCDNTSTIALSKNLVFHARTKHIKIKHHLLRDHVKKEDISLEFVDTNNQVADIFTKPLDRKKFEHFRSCLSLLEIKA